MPLPQHRERREAERDDQEHREDGDADGLEQLRATITLLATVLSRQLLLELLLLVLLE